MTDNVVLVEVHHTEGSPRKFAKRWVEKNYPETTVVNVNYSGMRCNHGFPVWSVTTEEVS